MAEYHIPKLTAGKLDPGVLPDGGGTGTDGASAYEVAVANGFVGSESEWLASLKGEPGDTGGGEAGPLAEFTGLPAAPVAWLPYQYRITHATALPGTIVWASGEPVIGNWGIAVLVWDGETWRGEWAEMDPTPPGGTSPIEVTPTGPTWVDDSTNGGGTWTTPTEAGVTYSPASGTAQPDEQVTVTATAATGYTLLGTTSWVHAFPPAPIPEDTTDPAPGTLTDSAHTSSGFTLTVTGASDAGSGLHAQPYRFSTDNGATWTAWQASASYTATGLAVETAYTCLHEVRDAAGNTAQGASIQAATTVPAVVVHDTFSRTPDSATSLDNADVTGQAWTAHSGTWGTVNGAAYTSVSSSLATATIDAGVSDCDVTWTMGTVNVNASRLVLRFTNASNYIYVSPSAGDGNKWAVTPRVDNTPGSPAPGTAVAANGDVVRVRCVGSAIDMYVNGSLALSTTIAHNATATRHGIISHNSTTPRYAEFKVESL